MLCSSRTGPIFVCRHWQGHDDEIVSNHQYLTASDSFRAPTVKTKGTECRDPKMILAIEQFVESGTPRAPKNCY